MAKKYFSGIFQQEEFMATFTVSNTNDSGLGSLRQAIANANGLAGLDTIEFTNNLSGQEIILTSGELQITDDLTINGLGADLLAISGNNTSRVFLVDDGDNSNAIDVTLNGLTITEGTSNDGGGIRNLENLTVLNSEISDNGGVGISSGSDTNSSGSNLTIISSNISDNAGTGISHGFGNLTLLNSTISDNIGWGINSGHSSLEITRSTISGNASGGMGVGLINITLTESTIANNTGSGIDIFKGSFAIDNSTISGNTTTGSGGGINAGPRFVNGTITNSRITNNIADRDGDGNGNGGGLFGSGGAGIGISNTIIAGNLDNSPVGSEQHPDISGQHFGSNGYNFVGDITGLRFSNTFTSLGDLFGTSENPLPLSSVIDGTLDDDSLAGTGGTDRIAGGDGNDTLRGRGGVDVLLGQADDDSLRGGAGDDTLNGGSGNDILLGQADNDYLVGEDGNDTLNGGNGNDQLFGEADDDRLVGGNGDDTLDGGTGADQLLGQGNNDHLLGHDGNDTLNGGAGNDQLFGESGDDRLVGGDGDDTLNGGIGQDVLIGNAGSDRFMLVSGVTGDRDIIRDYQDGLDRLVLTGNLSFDDLTISQSGANTRIRETATNQTLAILNGITASNITHDDFEFGAGLNGIRVEAEDYVNYYDTTPGNSGGAYRNDDVDLEPTSDLGGGYNVGYIADGEWLTYNVNLAESGLYQVVARVASATEDGRRHQLDISLDGQSTSLYFDTTGGWQSWTDVSGDHLNLSAGSHELRLDMGSAGFNVNYVDLIPLAGIRVEAEDYVNYYDTTPGNNGGAYRNDDVDIEPSLDFDNGFSVGWIDQGEWLTYDVEIPESGQYQVVGRVASASNQAHSVDVSLGGQSTSLNFGASGGWYDWIDVSSGEELYLNAGSYELRLDMGSSAFNLNYVDLISLNNSAISSISNDELLGNLDLLPVVDDVV